MMYKYQFSFFKKKKTFMAGFVVQGLIFTIKYEVEVI